MAFNHKHLIDITEYSEEDIKLILETAKAFWPKGVALAKTFESGWNASVGVVGATNNRFYRPPTGGLSATDGATRALNRPTLVLHVGKTF